MKRSLIAASILLVAAHTSTASPTANSVITPQTPNRGIAQFLQGTDVAGTYKTLYTAGSNGSKCFAAWATNNDPSATHLITLQVVNTTVKYGGMSLTSVVNAGFANGAPAQNLMSPTIWPGLPVDSDGNPFIMLASGDTLQATFATALTASAVINLDAVCSDF
jgi:hypothetical protein